MKWLIYVLLLGNAVFFAWQYQEIRQASRVHDVARRAQALPTLMLLSEARPMVPPEGAPREGLAVDAPVADAPPTPQGNEVLTAPPAVPAADTETAESAMASAGRPAETPASSTPLEPYRPSEPAPPPEPAAPSGVAESTRCFEAGPLPEEKVAQAVEDLEALGVKVQVRWETTRKPRSYWVYLPPFPNIDAAREMLRRLKADEVRDFIRVMKGSDRNAISLGLYSRQGTAQKRVEQLREKGYEPELDVRYQETRSAWLETRSDGPEPPGPNELQELTPDLTWALSDCQAR